MKHFTEDTFEISKVDNVELDGINHNDYPDFVDGFVSSADYNGEEMTEDELNWLQENYGDWVYDKIIDSIF